MQLKVIGSGSSGNLYIMEAKNGDNIIIESGLGFKKISKAMDFDFSKTAFSICTHAHKDHSVGTRALMDAGVKVVMSAGTYSTPHVQGPDKSFIHHNFIKIKRGQKYSKNGFEVVAFDINHDCPGKEPLGFLIKHEECGTTLFLTDSYYCDYTFPGLTNLMVEANFSMEIMQRRCDAGELNLRLKDRIFKSHMSLDNCISFLKANDISKVHNILLIHLSAANSDADHFKKEVYKNTLKRVTIAEPGVTLNWGLTPYS